MVTCGHWMVLHLAQKRDCANWSTGMKFGTDVDKYVLIVFLTTRKSRVISNNTLVSTSWTLDSSGHGNTEKGLYKSVYRYGIWYRCRIDYIDAIFSGHQSQRLFVMAYWSVHNGN